MATIVLHFGRIAWAVCVDQPEDLGRFLCRMGRITQEDLATIRRTYEQYEGRRKLGTLLEETGIVSRPVLRRCLLLHTRKAIARMLSYDNAHLEELENTLVADDDMMFSLEEIMPEFSMNQPSDANSSPYGGGWPEGNELLGELSSIPGYAASAVVHTDGEILASHSDSSEVNALLATLLASTVEVAVRAMWAANAGELESIYIGGQQGSLVIHRVSSARIHLVVVLLDSTGKPGMARHRLGAVIMELRKGLARIIHE